MKVTFIFVVFKCIVFSCVLMTATSMPDEILEKRSAATNKANEDYPDYQLGVRYDEYPMIVPKKRTALLVNRLMVALKDALEEEERERIGNTVNAYGSNRKYLNSGDIRTMDLQRRGHQSTSGQNKARIYWRCYFNAVTCF